MMSVDFTRHEKRKLMNQNDEQINELISENVRPLSSSPLLFAVFAPTLFEFDPIKSSSPLD